VPAAMVLWLQAAADGDAAQQPEQQQEEVARVLLQVRILKPCCRTCP
jgi:hypothetical protein